MSIARRCRGLLTGMPIKDFSAWTTSPLAILTVWRGDLISEDGWRLVRNWRLLKDSRSNEKSFAAPGPAPLGALVRLR